jgi:hypothetical protein
MTRVRGSLRLALVVLAVTALLVPVVASASHRDLLAKLKGKNEAPQPFDPDGKGDALINSKTGKRKVCYELDWKKIQAPTAAHIHKGAKGVAGPIEVSLFSKLQSGKSADGCVKKDLNGDKLNKKLLKKINRKPEKFYVNVHNAEFPGGAIRGQLKKP